MTCEFTSPTDTAHTSQPGEQAPRLMAWEVEENEYLEAQAEAKRMAYVVAVLICVVTVSAFALGYLATKAGLL